MADDHLRGGGDVIDRAANQAEAGSAVGGRSGWIAAGGDECEKIGFPETELRSLFIFLIYRNSNYLTLNVTLIAIIFKILGYLFNKNIIRLNKFLQIKYLPIFLLINISTCYLNYKLTSTQVDMYSNRYGNYFLFIF